MPLKKNPQASERGPDCLLLRGQLCAQPASLLTFSGQKYEVWDTTLPR